MTFAVVAESELSVFRISTYCLTVDSEAPVMLSTVVTTLTGDTVAFWRHKDREDAEETHPMVVQAIVDELQEGKSMMYGLLRRANRRGTGLPPAAE